VGKSFVCSNLAVTIAQAQRVLLIDADMRRGTLHRVLGVRAEDGLSELISGQIPLEDAIRRVSGTENLSFISRGRIPPNPSELLMHANFASLMHQLGSVDRDHDSPPVLAVTDAAIGQHAGTSLLVVRYGISQSREIAIVTAAGAERCGAEGRDRQRRAKGKRSLCRPLRLQLRGAVARRLGAQRCDGVWNAEAKPPRHRRKYTHRRVAARAVGGSHE
jgi:capsular exopolysaccharide synthesis family protein